MLQATALIEEKVKSKQSKKKIKDDVLKLLKDRDLGELKDIEKEFDVCLTIPDNKFVLFPQIEMLLI